MTWRFFSGSREAALDLLNGSRRIGPFPVGGLPIGGKTLLVGGKTITFPGDEGANVSVAQFCEALSEVEGLHYQRRAGSSVPQPGGSGHDSFVSIFGDEGFTFGSGGTANEALGLSTEEDTKVRKPLSLDNVKAIARMPSSDYEVIMGGPDAELDGE